MGKLLVHIAENGHSYELDCHESTFVEEVQKYIDSVCSVPANDQLLLCMDMKLEPQRPLSTYKLPSDDREVFLFNKARMRSNSAPPPPEQVQFIDIPDPQSPSPSRNPHPLDDAPDPALKALSLYERQFMHHFQCAHVVYSRTSAKLHICEKLLQEQKIQERALDIAKGNLEHFYKIVLQNYTDFIKCYSQQQQTHASLLVNFSRDLEKLRSIKLIPFLQTSNRKCLLDFVKEENLRKTVDDCSSSHKQFEKKVSEFKLEFADLKRHTETLLSGRESFLVKDLYLAIKDHEKFINEQKSIMQALSKSVSIVKKLVDDSIPREMSSDLSYSQRPHDAVSALGPMYDSHEKSYLPRMQACDQAISSLLDLCSEKKNEMNVFVHNYMQKIAYIQYTIKDARYKFSVFQEALKRQNDQFEHLKVVRGIGPAYRSCLAEVVRRKAAMKMYMGKAGHFAEKLAVERIAEIQRRDEFLKVQSAYIPRDVLAAMGLYDIPSSCDVNISPFDLDLIDIDLSDIDRYAPESLIGTTAKSKIPGPLMTSLTMSSVGSQSAEVEVTGELNEDFHEISERSELVEIAGTSKMEVENAKLKAELASKIALLCSVGAGLDYEDSKVATSLKNAAEKTGEALQLKEEYEKHLQAMLKVKQMQCKSYEKRIQELEQRLCTGYTGGCKISAGAETHFSAVTANPSEKKSQMHMAHEMDEVSCASSPSKLGSAADHDKALEGVDDNMADSSSILNIHMGPSLIDINGDGGHCYETDEKETTSPDENTALGVSMTASVSQPLEVASYGTSAGPCFESGESQKLVIELRDALAEKSTQLGDAQAKIQGLMDDVMRLERVLDGKQKLLDESQLNCAHLENCLHEAREEAQIHLCAADRRASEYSALRVSALKVLGYFERLRSCVMSTGVAAFADSLRVLAQSLANSAGENEDNGITEFRDCVRVLADKVSLLSMQRMELLDRYAKVQAGNEQLSKEVEDKAELISTLYMKLQLEKQANKERISFSRIEVHEIAAFVLNSTGYYEAINRNCHYYYLSAESVALFMEHLSNRPRYIVGQVVHIERQTVKPPQATAENSESVRDQGNTQTLEIGTKLLALNSSSASNPFGLPAGCEYFVVTIAMLPGTTIHPLPDLVASGR